MKQKSKTILLVAAVLIAGILIFQTAQNINSQYIEGACSVLFTVTPNGCTVTFGSVTKTSGDAGTQLSFGYIDSTHAHTVPWSVSKSGYITQSGTASITLNQRVFTKTVVLTANPGAPPPPVTYLYTIVTTPSGASVTIGGVTKTSVASFSLTAGTYSVTISKSGYTTKTYSVTISKTKTDSIVLTPTSGTTPTTSVLKVTVTSLTGAVAGATVTSSSVSKITDMYGVASITVPSGEQTLSVSAEGYELYTKIIDVTADMSWDVTLTPIISPTPPGGTVTIKVTVITTTSSNIEGATVQIGTVTGTTTTNGVAILTVPSTTEAVVLTVSKPGYTSFTNVLYPSTNMDFTVALKSGGGLGIPGFEMGFVILAIGIVMITFAYRKKRK